MAVTVEETREDHLAPHVDDPVTLWEMGAFPNGDNNPIVDGDAPLYYPERGDEFSVLNHEIHGQSAHAKEYQRILFKKGRIDSEGPERFLYRSMQDGSVNGSDGRSHHQRR